MLVISRHLNERLRIRDSNTGELIAEITLCELVNRKGQKPKAKLGVQADKRYVIDREEIDERKILEMGKK